MTGYRKFRCIRKITNSTFGINIPEDVASEYSGVFFKVVCNGENIILESGARI